MQEKKFHDKIKKEKNQKEFPYLKRFQSIKRIKLEKNAFEDDNLIKKKLSEKIERKKKSQLLSFYDNVNRCHSNLNVYNRLPKLMKNKSNVYNRV